MEAGEVPGEAFVPGTKEFSDRNFFAFHSQPFRVRIYKDASSHSKQTNLDVMAKELVERAANVDTARHNEGATAGKIDEDLFINWDGNDIKGSRVDFYHYDQEDTYCLGNSDNLDYRHVCCSSHIVMSK